MKKTILIACVILAVMAGTALAQKGYSFQDRAKINFLDVGTTILNCVNRHSDSLLMGDVVEFDTIWTAVIDTAGVPSGSKYFGMGDTGAFGGTTSAANYPSNDRPTFRLYFKILGTSSAADTFFVMGKDSAGTFQKDSVILASGANKLAVSDKAFWEIDSIGLLGAASGDSITCKMIVRNGVILGSGTENNRGLGVVVGRYTASSTAAFTKAGIRQVLRVAVGGHPVRAKCTPGSGVVMRCGTPIANASAGVFVNDGTLATGYSAGTALEGCTGTAKLRWILLDRN